MKRRESFAQTNLENLSSSLAASDQILLRRGGGKSFLRSKMYLENRYEDELREQMESKKRSDEEQKRKEREEEERLDRRTREQQERMKREFDEETNKKKAKEEAVS